MCVFEGVLGQHRSVGVGFFIAASKRPAGLPLAPLDALDDHARMVSAKVLEGNIMATFGIDAVRINPSNDRITHVRWAAVDPATRSWLSPTSIVEVAQVVDAIHRGDAVWSLFTLGGTRFLGPKIVAVSHTNGHDGIDTDVPDSHIEKCIDDLPRI
ncbi:MAG: hypothetical protein PPHEMADMSA_3214 [uncultured Paraburkholderia sp.]|nr:MAG: hypothetical protein PPHEMADMSA_3214 [uncultured Paraburkholderia sp.]